MTDLRRAVRAWLNDPVIAATATLTLVLGIGANTAVFSVVDAVLFRPLPFRDPERLVRLGALDPRDPEAGLTYDHFLSLNARARAFDGLAVFYRNSGWSKVTLTSGDPESAQGAFTSASFFRVMGVAPALGRAFGDAEEQQREPVVVLSDRLWKRRVGAAPAAIGGTLDIDGAPFRIVGVMPPTFQFPARDVQFWAPITTNRYWLDRPAPDPARNVNFFQRWNLVGRLKADVSVAAARAEANAIARVETGVAVAPLDAGVNAGARRALQLLLGAVFVVWLMACSNVMNLMLARGSARARELAVRTALGATRSHLTRQAFIEASVLLAASSVLGIGVAAAVVRAIAAAGPADLPRLEQAAIDGRVLLFALVAAAVATSLIAMIPAWRASGQDAADVLRAGTSRATHSSTRVSRLLVAGQFALAVVLLVGAGLLIRTAWALDSVDLGFRAGHAVTMNVALPALMPVPQRLAFYERLLARLRSMPGVEAAGAINGLFENGAPPILGFRAVEGRSAQPRDRWTALTWTVVSGDFFRAVGARVVRGRVFTDRDTAASPLVAVVDQSLAQRYWPGEDPIGRRFKGQDMRRAGDEWLTVIGVVQDMRRQGRDRASTPHVFEWQPQTQSTGADVVVRTAGDPLAMIAGLRTVVREEEPTAITSSIGTLESRLRDQLAVRRFQTWLLAAFAAIAVALAGAGIFGVVSHAVAQRTQELGIRMALGARAVDVLAMVFRDGATVSAAGLLAGLVLSLWLTRLLVALLYGVQPTDVVTFAGAVAVLAAIAIAAMALPAWRAARVDPLIALRTD
jgi:predicted permease